MTTGIATWDDVGPIAGHVLLIVNSALGDTKSVDQIVDTLILRTNARDLFVVAAPRWKRHLTAKGLRRSQILTTRDLELNFFLQTRKALKWLVRKRFAVVVGSAAHSRYNEEVKDIFEQRVAAFLGSGQFPYPDSAAALSTCNKPTIARKNQAHEVWVEPDTLGEHSPYLACASFPGDKSRFVAGDRSPAVRR